MPQTLDCPYPPRMEGAQGSLAERDAPNKPINTPTRNQILIAFVRALARKAARELLRRPSHDQHEKQGG